MYARGNHMMMRHPGHLVYQDPMMQSQSERRGHIAQDQVLGRRTYRQSQSDRSEGNGQNESDDDSGEK